MASWYHDESFWTETFPFMFSDERMQAAGDEADRMLILADFEGDAVLDLCCGPGRHSVRLAGQGLKVTGVDVTPFLLDKARALADAAGVSVEWVLSDMLDFSRPAAFDFAMSMFTSFGYFEKEEDDLAVLTKVCENLKPGGVFLIDVLSKERLARTFQPTISELLDDGSVLIQRNRIVDDWTGVSNEWIVVRGGRARTFHFRLTIYSGRELKDRLFEAGFDEVRLFGDLDGGPYGYDAERLIAVARKGS
jgi:SAM-dependent methyltransferase